MPYFREEPVENRAKTGKVYKIFEGGFYHLSLNVKVIP